MLLVAVTLLARYFNFLLQCLFLADKVQLNVFLQFIVIEFK